MPQTPRDRDCTRRANWRPPPARGGAAAGACGDARHPLHQSGVHRCGGAGQVGDDSRRAARRRAGAAASGSMARPSRGLRASPRPICTCAPTPPPSPTFPGERLRQRRATRAMARAASARLICDVLMPTGERFEGDPRAVLIAALDATPSRWAIATMSRLNWSSSCCASTPARAMREPLPHDRGGYFDLSTDLAADVRREIVRRAGRAWASASRAAITRSPRASTRLTSPPPTRCTSADAVVTARYVDQGHRAAPRAAGATFLPKPFYGINGSGMHTHQRLIRLSDGANAFADAADTQLWPLGARRGDFIAGQLAHARGHVRHRRAAGQLVQAAGARLRGAGDD